MATALHHIGQRKYVAVLRGAADVLVTHRELREIYLTNRSIKTWGTFFLLKSLSIPGMIKCWTSQKQKILSFCRMNEGSFRTRLREMKAMGLIKISKDLTITLTSFENAAKILGIEYTGTIKIEYNESLPGKNMFHYCLVMDEIRCNQNRQLEAINYKADKNPQLRELLEAVMIQHGADCDMLENKRYFQQFLLQIQLFYFKTGSDIWSVISQLRGDINRSVYGIKKQYGYKSTQSVSYLKQRLAELEIATIEKTKVESDVRTRLYIPNGEGKRRDGVKYCWKTKRTVLFLCDAIKAQIRIIDTQTVKKEKMKVA